MEMNHKAKAIELLGEQRIRNCTNDARGFGWRDGYNQMHSKAVGVVVGLLGKINELEKKLKSAKALIKELGATNDK